MIYFEPTMNMDIVLLVELNATQDLPSNIVQSHEAVKFTYPNLTNHLKTQTCQLKSNHLNGYCLARAPHPSRLSLV